MKYKEKWPPQTDRKVLWQYVESTRERTRTRRLLLSYSGAELTELSPETSRTLGRSRQTNTGPTNTKCRCNSPRQIKGTQETSRDIWQQLLTWLLRQSEGIWQYIWKRLDKRQKKSDFPRRIKGTPTVKSEALSNKHSQPGNCCSSAQEQAQDLSADNTLMLFRAPPTADIRSTTG